MPLTKHIVIADDDPGIQEVFQLIFKRAEYHVTIYSDAGPLMRLEFENADLFLLDKQLSGVDGIDVCRFLKRHPLTKNIPVIMISANPGIIELAKDCRADDVIEKPFSVKVLLDKVAKQLRIAENV
jgi:CheY-like chemotaxis protein